MQGAITLRPQRLMSSVRARGPLSYSPSRPICLLCQQKQFTSNTLKLASQRQKVNPSSNPLTPDITNHYTIFPNTLPQGPPPNSSFSFDTSALRREFLQLQNAFHPDKFPQGPEKQRSEALSSRINDAYRTLIDPLSRAQYLLSHFHGIDVLAEDSAQTHPLDSETLMEVMDVQEAVEELSSAPVAEAEATVARLREENATRIEETVDKLHKAFDSGDIETAQRETVRLRFWYSLRDGLREWEHGHGAIRIVH
ncbi:DnaJ domain protein [Talaromyces stipitatus ATCC 10500]|uniref:DnaJ domain protein n=1 Tax=Talaromyces stipitatus (strain ATCC 10500 / CBS 375.48 / QM 6759 / NRRL 1006) TaxID=441959 RepID=B8ME24_TALSN|nr:DnaJ domain protein [Talaromyces stipitatus ATCC 10500]EED16101.1 DnaJ domain protein [Talaromyces stipitatus ATCC 10500]